MDRGVWRATVLRVTKSWIWLKWLSTCAKSNMANDLVRTEETHTEKATWRWRQKMKLCCGKWSDAKDCQQPPAATSDHQGPPATTISHHQPPGTTISHHRPPVTTRGHQRPPAATSHHQGPPRTTISHHWPPVMTSGHHRPPVTTSSHQGPPAVRGQTLYRFSPWASRTMSGYISPLFGGGGSEGDWPCHVACSILAPWPGIEPRLLAVKPQSPNHRTNREFPNFCGFKPAAAAAVSRIAALRFTYIVPHQGAGKVGTGCIPTPNHLDISRLVQKHPTQTKGALLMSQTPICLATPGCSFSFPLALRLTWSRHTAPRRGSTQNLQWAQHCPAPETVLSALTVLRCHPLGKTGL